MFDLASPVMRHPLIALFVLAYAITWLGAEPLDPGTIAGAVLVGAAVGPRSVEALVGGLILMGGFGLYTMVTRRTRYTKLPAVAALCTAGIGALVWPG
jgi:hypothetical protein